MNHEEEHHIVPYGTFILVWLGLLALTGITVAISGMNLQMLSVAVALIIATLKGGLVVSFFMHLKYEALLFKIIFICALTLVAIFIGFTFFDYSFR